MRTVRTALVLAVAACAALFVPETAWADSTRSQQWYLQTWNMAEVHKITKGKGITIGLIDSGVNAEHPDLKGAVTAGKGFGDDSQPLVDRRNHGTSMAALVVGRGHGAAGADGILGIAPEANLISVSLNWKPRNAGQVELWQGQAIQWLVDQDVDVIVTATATARRSDPLGQEAVNNAMAKGIPVIASAGNLKFDNGKREKPHDITEYPAAYQNAIAVHATTRSGTRWEGSVLASRQAWLSFAAPGHRLPAANSDGSGYPLRDGTSGAAPLVAGTFALLKARYPDRNWADLVWQVMKTLTDVGPKGWDKETGWGIVDPLKALTEPMTTAPSQSPTYSPKPRTSSSDATVAASNDDGGALLAAAAGGVGALLLGGGVVTIVLVRRQRRRMRAAATAYPPYPVPGGPAPYPPPPGRAP